MSTREQTTLTKIPSQSFQNRRIVFRASDSHIAILTENAAKYACLVAMINCWAHLRLTDFAPFLTLFNQRVPWKFSAYADDNGGLLNWLQVI